MKGRRMSRLRHKKLENLFNKRKDEMQKKLEMKTNKVSLLSMLKKNNKIKSETAEID